MSDQIDVTRYRQLLLQNARELLEIDSPTGFTGRAAEYLLKRGKELGYPCSITQKGCVTITIPGRNPAKTVLISGQDRKSTR